MVNGPALSPPFLHAASNQNWMVGRPGNEANKFCIYPLLACCIWLCVLELHSITINLPNHNNIILENCMLPGGKACCWNGTGERVGDELKCLEVSATSSLNSNDSRLDGSCGNVKTVYRYLIELLWALNYFHKHTMVWKIRKPLKMVRGDATHRPWNVRYTILHEIKYLYYIANRFTQARCALDQKTDKAQWHWEV